MLIARFHDYRIMTFTILPPGLKSPGEKGRLTCCPLRPAALHHFYPLSLWHVKCFAKNRKHSPLHLYDNIVKTTLVQMDPRKTTVTVSTDFPYCQFTARQSGGTFQKIAIWNSVVMWFNGRNTTKVYSFMLKLLLWLKEKKNAPKMNKWLRVLSCVVASCCSKENGKWSDCLCDSGTGNIAWKSDSASCERSRGAIPKQSHI